MRRVRLTPEQIENDDEDDCSRRRARLKAVGKGSVRTGQRASPARYVDAANRERVR
jgi:hypothetical protein